MPKLLASMSDWVRTSGSWAILTSVTVGDRWRSFAIAWREGKSESCASVEGSGHSQQTNLVEVTLHSTEADKVQRRLALLENHMAGTAAALGSEDDVVRRRHATHPANGLRSLWGKGLTRDLNQVNIFHHYVGHLSIVVEEVVDLRRARIALGEVGQIDQRHNLGVEGRVWAELDKVLTEWEAATVVAVVLILAFMLGAGAHDGWLEGGKVRGLSHQWQITWVNEAIRKSEIQVSPDLHLVLFVISLYGLAEHQVAIGTVLFSTTNSEDTSVTSRTQRRLNDACYVSVGISTPLDAVL